MNTYVSANDADLDLRTVKVFADASARTTGIPSPTDGMVTYLTGTDSLEVYDGSAWTALGGGGGFTASTAITATDASWTVPTLADPVVRVTVVGGGGGGGRNVFTAGSAGVSSSFASSAGTATATGGAGGIAGSNTTQQSQSSKRFMSYNGGQGGQGGSGGLWYAAPNAEGGEIVVAYFDLTGVSTASVTVGAGGSPNYTGSGGGQEGGDGVVIVEYRAG
jgi:hypothetical protein